MRLRKITDIDTHQLDREDAIKLIIEQELENARWKGIVGGIMLGVIIGALLVGMCWQASTQVYPTQAPGNVSSSVQTK